MKHFETKRDVSKLSQKMAKSQKWHKRTVLLTLSLRFRPIFRVREKFTDAQADEREGLCRPADPGEREGSR